MRAIGRRQICPKTLRGVWEAELTNLVPGITLHHIRAGKDAAKAPPPNSTGGPFATIVTWGLMTALADAKAPAVTRFSAVIADESHNMKSSEAARTIAAKKIIRKAARVALLSGTPSLNRPFELYEQARGLGWCKGSRPPALMRLWP